jgi:hypothetical protein
MEGTPAPETREKLSHWVQEGLKLFPYLATLLQGEEGGRARELERELDKVRRELSEARKEADDLRKEYERLRADRDEVGQALGRLVDSVQPISHMAQRLGFRRSPFDREHRPPAEVKAPAEVKPPGEGKPPSPTKTPADAKPPAPAATPPPSRADRTSG